MIDWKPYLESISNTYAQWWTAYTVTDVKSSQQVRTAPPLLNFMMVETIQPVKEDPNQKQEKIERLVALEGMRKYAEDHVLLVGRPGSGKSTALARLLLEEAKKCEEAEEQQKIPVLLALRDYQTSVLNLICSFFQQHKLLLGITEIKRLLSDKQLLLLVDGLNELPLGKARKDLDCFRRENQATTPMIFTTRDLSLGGDLGIAKKLEMQPLTDNQMRDFVKSYLPAQGDLLLQQLSVRLREFGQTPLLLLMLCSIFPSTGNVPSNLGLVFREFVKDYDFRRLQDVSVTDELRRWWRRLLEHLAWKMTQGRELTQLQVAIPKYEAEEIFTEFLRQEEFDKPRDLAMDWLERSLKHHLIQVGAGDKIEFRHQLIQEYYTAESLLKQLPQLSDDKLKQEYLNYLKWTEPLALMLEMVEQEEQAQRVVKLALEVDFRLAARLAGAVKLKFQNKMVALVAEIEIAQEVKDKLLGITRSSSAVAILQEALSKEDPNVRRRAVYALGEIGSEAAVPALVEALNDEDPNVRWSAAEALGEIGSEAIVPVLVKVLNSEDPNVRESAAEALGEIGNKAAVPALVKALNDEDPNVRESAVYALRKIGNEAAVPALVKALNDEDQYVRWSAVYVLGEIGNEAAVPALVKVLNDEDQYVRWSVVYVLGEIGNEAAVPALVEALNHEDPNVRESAVYALGKIGNEAAVPALVEALNHEDPNVRESAVYALGKIATPELLPCLSQLLQTTRESDLFNTIAAIQERCKYYNYTLTQLETSLNPQPNIPLIGSISVSIMHILHLSDLHFGTSEDAKQWYSQLEADLHHELKCRCLDAIILSGDIANKSTPEEYSAANLFLNRLIKQFQLTSDRIVLVPGNHDLNWGLSRQSYTLIDRQEYQGELHEGCYIPEANDIIRVRDDDKYRQRFANFSNFYQEIKGEPYPLEYEQQGILHHLPEQNLLILGLNSVWQLDHHYKSRASIHPIALSNALETINTDYTTYEKCLKIAVWHHPLDSTFADRITDRGFMEQLAVTGFRLFLHGHIHKAETSHFCYDLSTDGRRLNGICAGTFGAPMREWVPGYPLQYNLLKFEGNKLTVHTRRREELNGAC